MVDGGPESAVLKVSRGPRPGTYRETQRGGADLEGGENIEKNINIFFL